jgi:hypothetical protein
MNRWPWRRLSTAFIILAAVISAEADALAQSRRLVGQRMRVRAPRVSQKWIDGTLRSADDSAVAIVRSRTIRDTVIIPIDAIRRAEVAEGKRSNMLLGAVVGLAFGALTGAAVHGLTGGDSHVRDRELALGVGAGAGFVVGTVVGITSESIVWREIPPSRLRRTGLPRAYGQVMARWTWQVL